MANYSQKIKKILKSRNGNFTQVPNEIFDADISIKAKMIWIYILSLPRDRDICQAYFVKKFGLSKGTVTKLVQELETKGLLDIHRKGPRSDFTVNPIPVELLPKKDDDQDLTLDETKIDLSRAKKQTSKGQKSPTYKYEHEILNTTERKRSGKYSNSTSKDTKFTPPKKIKTTPNSDSPESCLHTNSEWYQWLINKHGKILFHFPTLPYDERLKWATKYGVGADKEQFIDEYLRCYDLISGLMPDELDI